MDFQSDPDKMQQLVDYLESGAPRETAMKALGVPRAEFRKFLDLATKGISPHAELLDSMQRAEARGECKRLALVMESKDWRASMTSLERQFPERYGQKVQVEVRQELEKVFRVIEANTTPEQYEAILGQLSGLGSSQNALSVEEEQQPQVH